jgi:hypothetical protein
VGVFRSGVLGAADSRIGRAPWVRRSSGLRNKELTISGVDGSHGPDSAPKGTENIKGPGEFIKE